jgi:transcriptional regulator with GAF, ATPase, and Fis domain
VPNVPREDAKTETLRLDPPFTRPCRRIDWQDAAGAHTMLVDRPIVVGSASTANVVLEDGTVSRLHAELEPRPDGLWVRDLGSRNGTFVNEVLVTAARIPDVARLRFGGMTVTLRPDREEAPVDLWPEDRLGGLVGRSTPMRELYATIVRVGASDAPVLVHGETGSGKELVARAIHDCSHRASGPFVVVDCAAIPEALLESELFGHAKGAFTGASGAHVGSFESADGGTILLDEIGELPLAMQPKLLRVLESRTIRRLGEANHRQVDVRVLSATHRDLRSMVNGGNFREDLYFRVAVLPVRVPPLRERTEDLPGLVAHFAPAMPDAERAALCRELSERRLEGNVRELRNLVERVSLLGHAHAMESLESAPPPGLGRDRDGDSASTDLPFDTPFHDFQREAEREYLRRLVVRHGGQVADAAQAAGLNRTYFYRLLRKHALW